MVCKSKMEHSDDLFRSKNFSKFCDEIKKIDSEKEIYLSGKIYHLNLYKIIAEKNLLEKLHPLVKKIIIFLNKLVVNKSEGYLIAHYTTPTVAYLMLDHKNQKKVSKLRLNPIDFMNDPTEGVLINQLFAFEAKQNPQLEQHKSFIGCFTLHHDSLNQFRLYGKENQREASGVSLVMDRSTLFEN